MTLLVTVLHSGTKYYRYVIVHIMSVEMRGGNKLLESIP